MELIKHLLAVGFLTGSRAFGTEKESSDWDIVYDIRDTETIQRIYSPRPITHSEYFKGYFITEGDVTINLIPVHSAEYFAWFLVTEAMKATWKYSEIQDRIQKYAMFQGIVAQYKGILNRKDWRGTVKRIRKERGDYGTEK